MAFIVLNAVIGMVTYVTLLERKFAARMQSRIGPYRVGPHGLLQPIADALKLMMKEDVVPRLADRGVYNLAPIVFLVPCMLIFATMPFAPGLGVADLNIGILFFLAVSAMEIVGLFMGGWGSNNKYALISRDARGEPDHLLRPAVHLRRARARGARGLAPALRHRGGAGGLARLAWFVFYPVIGQLAFVAFIVATLAAENRVPFDILEAESELVAGFRVEYSGMKFALIQLGEYAHMIGTSFLGALLFLGAWSGPGPEWLGPGVVPPQGDVRLPARDVDALELRADPRGPDPRHLVEAAAARDAHLVDGDRGRGRRRSRPVRSELGQSFWGELVDLCSAVGRAMRVTFVNFFRKPVTVHYPDVKRDYPDRFRGVLALTYDKETGEENCIGCRLCEYICPPQVIKVEMLKAEKRNFAKTFTLELYACEFCELCVQVCPTDAIIMMKSFDVATSDRRELLLDKDRLHHARPAVRALVGDRQPAARHADAAEGPEGGRPARQGRRRRRREPRADSVLGAGPCCWPRRSRWS